MGKHFKEVMQRACEIALSDSQTAFKSPYLAYSQRLIRFTSLCVPSSVEAEEVVSDTFLNLWSSRKSLPRISNFGSYIYGVARRKVISLYRTQHMEKVQIDENTIDLFAHTDTTPEEGLISKECIDHLNETINTLPDKCKMAFRPVHEDEMKYKDTTDILEISVETLEACIATTIRKLRESLAKEISG